VSPRERAEALHAALGAELRTTNGDCRWTEMIASALRAASAEAYERAAREVEGTPVSWTDQAESIAEAAARVRAIATKGVGECL
jgi:hypothetical protein